MKQRVRSRSNSLFCEKAVKFRSRLEFARLLAHVLPKSTWRGFSRCDVKRAELPPRPRSHSSDLRSDGAGPRGTTAALRARIVRQPAGIVRPLPLGGA